MPHQWNNNIAVTIDELVPRYYNNLAALQQTIHRYKDKPYGIKRLQRGGNGHPTLIDFDSLPREIQNSLGDPRRVDHILERFFVTDAEAVEFFSTYQFDDGTFLSHEYQERYVLNASVIKALFALKQARIIERRSKNGSLKNLMESIWNDAVTFNTLLKNRKKPQHTLPNNYKRFKQALNDFEKKGYPSLISGKHKNSNAQKVTEETLYLLNCMFGTQTRQKPTATEVHQQYAAFLAGKKEVFSTETGEQFEPKNFKKLSEATVKNYMAQWANKIGTYLARSGDRQKYMTDFDPYHALKRPKYAGSLISVDDRQPAFKCLELKGERIWFYNGFDVASNAITCWVYGKSKEGIILDFYRQMVRQYAYYGFCLPAEIEAEMNLNASFKDTFLKPGAMFQYVRIEANKARAKAIEGMANRELRYLHEKKEEGWRARPHARMESNQAGPGKDILLPYERIVEIGLRAIEDFNNQPHPSNPEITRWDYFCANQNPNLKPINYNSFMRHIGYKRETSCKVGRIEVNGQKLFLGLNGKISTGEQLIKLMSMAEGRELDVYWLDDMEGQLLKALVYLRGDDRLICEALPEPAYQRATIEKTDDDDELREIMSAYENTIISYGRRMMNSLEPVTIVEKEPSSPLKRSFTIPGLRRVEPGPDEVEILPDIPEDEFDQPVESTFNSSLIDRF